MPSGGSSGSSGGGSGRSTYDYEAERRAQEQAEAARRAEEERQAELERQRREAENKRIMEQAERNRKFLEDRDAAGASLRGSTGAGAVPVGSNGTGLRGSTGTAAASGGSGLRGSSADTGLRGLKTGATPEPNLDPMVVDARNVPSGLPASVEKAIPQTPAGDRVRKGFQAFVEHDWAVALAWFKDALNHEPGSPGLQRLVDLAQFTLRRQGEPAVKPTGAGKSTSSGEKDKMHKTGISQELFEAMDGYYKANPPNYFKSSKKFQSDEEWLKEKDPAWKTFFRMLTPKLKVKENGDVMSSGIRG
ncbi:MAG: hypothetical protein JJE30_00350 [Desulfuromonadales bacterium]|nr:hypothetical protein [Desulfuromonadales bacterium]